MTLFRSLILAAATAGLLVPSVAAAKKQCSGKKYWFVGSCKGRNTQRTGSKSACRAAYGKKIVLCLRCGSKYKAVGKARTCQSVQSQLAIRNCSSAATRDIKAAFKFITKNLERIMKKTSLKTSHRNRVRAQWHTVTVRCIDDKRACAKAGSTLFGRAHGFLTNNVNVCYQRHAKFKFCELADTLFHEVGHTLGIPYNNLKHKSGDRIYQMGYAAKKLCRKLGLDRNISGLHR